NAPVLTCSGFSTVDAELMARGFLELRKIRPDVLLLMTGGRIPAFEAAIRKAGAAQSVLHLGTLPYEKLGEALACGDVMWQPYGDAPVDLARFPNRFGEYIAAGRPIATNPGGDHSVIVQAEDIGVVTPVEPQATAEGIAALLDDPVRCARMGAHARELAVTRFSWRTIAAQAAELYEELLLDQSDTRGRPAARRL
ncbi:MAG: glycosyltransferase, partial [Anaerolineae bacterium]